MLIAHAIGTVYSVLNTVNLANIQSGPLHLPFLEEWREQDEVL